MKNQLKDIERNLRYIAKRNKSITFSLGLALIYLMLGINAFSEDVIATTNKQEIVMTAEKLEENLRNVKRENEKRLKGSQLELIQLMEQGNQVVKSPWASWQFGINFMYNNWSGSYRGRGDKKEKYPYEGIFTRSDDIFERSVSPLSKKYKELETATDITSASSNRRKGLPWQYGITSTTQAQEELGRIFIGASIKLKDVSIEAVDAPEINIQTPKAPNLTLPELVWPSLEIPTPDSPSFSAKIPEIDVNPITDYSFQHRSNTGIRWTELKEIDGLGYTYWSGYNPETGKSEDASRYWYDANTKKLQEVDQTPEYEMNPPHNKPLEALTYSTRVTNVFYLNYQDDRWTKPLGERGFIFDGEGANIWVQGRENPVAPYPKGTIALHTVWDGKISNVTGHLMGYSNFISTETWHAGKLTLDNVKVNIEKDDNSVFYIYPAGYEIITHGGFNSFRQRGEFNGNLNVDIKSKRNFVYSIMGTSGSYKIKSTGIYNITGSDNIVYLGYGYSPNFQNFLDKGEASGIVIDHDKKGMTPSIQLSTPVKSTGDDNIILMFGEIWKNKAPDSWINDNLDEWKKSLIGIYQGEIEAKANIGAEAQIAEGNKEGKELAYVEGNIGVYAKSGQRVGIKPEEDLGAVRERKRQPDPNNGPFAMPKYNLDLVHNLEIGAAEIYFGKYAKDGIMFAAENGTVIDIAKDKKADNTAIGEADYLEIIPSSEIKDSSVELISSADDNVNQAATGTIIAYANGVWDKNIHEQMSNTTKNALNGKGSEINIYKPVIISSRAKGDSTPVAYIADNGGIINAKKSTTAKGFSTVVALAQNKGKINIEGDVIAKDEWAAKDDATKPYLYKNVGALAKKDGEIELKANVDIYGIGAIADGENAKVTFSSNGNKIKTGKDGGLVALNGGLVKFSGGTITHTENEEKDHDEATPFYADVNSKIDFTGITTIEIGNGILMQGLEADYTKDSGTTTKYNGMGNVKVKLIKDNVILGIEKGQTLDWTGTSSGLDIIKNKMKLDGIDKNGKKYKVFYIDGNFNLKTNLDLDDASNDFYNLGLANEVFTIESDSKVISNTGKGLEMGSLSTAADNTTNKYINEGEVSITGGKYTDIDVSRALSVSFGTIHNKNLISVDKGVGAYGINGSSILNDTDGNINITKKGIGILAYASGSELETKYGTDKKILENKLEATDKVIEINNKGNITVDGEEGIGIYAELNNPSGLANFKRTNGLVKNSGKIKALGDKGIGIFSKGNNVVLSGSGSSDILVGKQGIGVFADDTTVSLSTDYGIEVKDEGTGIFVKDGSEVSAGNLKLTYTGAADKSAVGMFYDDNSDNTKTNITDIELEDKTDTTEGLIALYVKKNSGEGKLVNAAKIKGDKGYGIVTEGTTVENTGNITFTNPISDTKPSVGMFSREYEVLPPPSSPPGTPSTKTVAAMKNSGFITMGDNLIGMYGHSIENAKNIKVGNKGIAIYSMGGNVDLLANSKIEIGKEKAIGLYIGGTGQVATADNKSAITMGDDSFAFVNMGSGNTINSNIATQTLGNEAVYIYSKDTAGTVNNKTELNSTGNYNYGIYSAGTVNNTGNINFGTGKGNVGIYSTYGGTATNNAEITIGASHIDTDRKKDRYAIAMAAGFTPNEEELSAGKTPYTGNIKNEGTLIVDGEFSIGMYGTGKGTTVYNGTSVGSSALIKLKANNTTGIYLDNEAYGYNYGTIISEGTGLNNLTGVVVKNRATLENHGLIELNAENALGVLRVGDETETDLEKQKATLGIIKNYGTFKINGKVNTGSSTSPTLVDTKEEIESIVENLSGSSDLSKKLSNGVEIVVPTVPSNEAIKINGEPVKPPQLALTGTTGEVLKKMQVSKIGMYIDTSSKNYTTPILGLNALSNLKKADLIIGTEAAQNTTSKYIMIEDSKILDPYNEMILRNTHISEWNVYSNSLTWYATAAKDERTNKLNTLYLAKEKYTKWAGKEPWPVDKKDTYNFTDGLEQRYGVEGIGTRENQLFQKLNSIGKNEEILLYQAFDEMMGHQYANVQQRIHSTGQILDKEFDYLKDEWRTASKDSNKVKVFGMKGEYSTDTAGVIDYKNNAYGVAYVGENETVKLGNTTGWYTGLVHNTFKFKDIGNSKEEMLQAKLGLFNSKAFDDNNSLNWTISGEAFVGYNKMHRKFLVVDEIFNARSRYWSYGVALKNELSKTFRLSEDFSLRGYGSIKAEYGRFQKIKEKSGEVRLEVKANDYISIKPEIGGELIYKTPLSGRNFFNAKLGVAYENELGRVGDAKNKARVGHTTADWFNIRGEKEDRRGNVRTDLSLGWDNEAYGITANIGYDTKGKNRRAGLGLRVIF